MIALVTGALRERELDQVVIDCHGVGYALSCSLTTLAALPPLGSEVTLFVYTHVAEDVLRLYGFAARQERHSFTVLMATAGVGPKLALAILSTLSVNELQAAVARRDKTALTRIPGVGGKKAERLLLELKDKLGATPQAPSPGAARAPGDDALEDLRSALTNLGFAREVADAAAAEARQKAPPGANLATLLRAALRSISPRKS